MPRVDMKCRHQHGVHVLFMHMHVCVILDIALGLG